MAKRKAKARAKKGGRKGAKKTTRRAARPARKAASRKAVRKSARPKARAARKAAKPARKRAATRVAFRKPAAPKRVGREGGRVSPKRLGREGGRPKPAALSRERRQLRDEETFRGAPSTLNFSAKASAAESGQHMYHQRGKEHTEGGAALTGGDVDTDWNEAYASGEETPGGDMSTPDQDVVEEIGRALGVEYEDSEELKGAEKIEGRDRNRWEYDPASAEDYKDRNRRED